MLLSYEKSATRALAQGRKGMVSSPHHLASLAGLAILQEGGNAVDAAIAVNATLAVVYPHMTGLGGDSFWLIHDAGENRSHAFNGTGRAISGATPEFYRSRGHSEIPARGILGAITVPGAVDAWCKAHEKFGRLPLAACLSHAIDYAREGYPVSRGQERFTRQGAAMLAENPSGARVYMPNGSPPKTGDIMRNTQLADTLAAIAREGRSGFYEGSVRDEMVRALNEGGPGCTPEDFSSHHGDWNEPISTTYRGYTCLQHPPNSQGFVHLMALNILENFDLASLGHDSAAYVHLLVEATKLSFIDRDRYLTDPDHVSIPMDTLLSKEYAASLAARISMDATLDIESMQMGQDTTCAVVVDGDGNAASIIQSIYHEFGSGFVAGETGVVLQNRGSFFSLDPEHVNSLKPGKRCFHTLMPGLMLKDGRLAAAYGTMGGEGQPQTSTALITRMVDFGLDAQDTVDAPRWLYGRTWGAETKSLRVEQRFSDEDRARLKTLGHEVETVEAFSDAVGHAAAICVDHETGVLSGGADPRSDGIAVGW